LHRRHHRRVGFYRGFPAGRDPRRADGELRRLPVPEDVTRLEHALDDGDPVVAAVRPPAGRQGMSAMATNAISPTAGRGVPVGRLVVYGVVLAIGLALMFAPFLFPDVRAQEVAARICVFIVLVASYDLLIGYTGIVSFAHTMFFGLGAYGTAIALKTMGAGFDAILIGGGAGVLAALVLAVLIGLLSLRVKAIFFAMVTLAAASVMMVLASQLSDFTGGEDGITYSIPRFFSPANELLTGPDGKALRLFGIAANGRLALYYFVFLSSLALFLLMLRIVASPLGTVLQAIRENELRAEA